MNIEQLRNFALALGEVEECTPFGPDTLVYKVNGKVFLLLPLDASPVQFNAKCDPVKALELREQYESVRPGYHMNKKHWNTVIIDGQIETSLLKELVRDSYDLVSKRKR